MKLNIFCIMLTFILFSNVLQATMFIINLGRGVTANGIITANISRGVETKYFNLITKERYKQLNDFKEVQETDHIVIIGHCNESIPHLLSGINETIFTSNDLGMLLQRSSSDLIRNQKALLVSLIACNSANTSNSPSQSLAENFLQKLNKISIKAHIIGRTKKISSVTRSGFTTVDPRGIRKRLIPNLFQILIGDETPKYGDSILFAIKDNQTIKVNLSIEPALDFSLRQEAYHSAMKAFKKIRKKIE